MASAGNHRYAKALVFEESSDYNSGESNTLVCQNGILYFNGKQLSSNTGNQFDIFTANKVTRLSDANIQWESNLVVLPTSDPINNVASAGQGFQSDGEFLYYNGIQISAFSNIYQDDNSLTSNSIAPLSNTNFVVNSNLIVKNVMWANAETFRIDSKYLNFSNIDTPTVTFDATNFNFQPVSNGTNVQFLGALNGDGSDCNVNFVSSNSYNVAGTDVVNLKFKNKGDSGTASNNHTIASIKAVQTTAYTGGNDGGGSISLTCRDPTQLGVDGADTQLTMLYTNTHTSANSFIISPSSASKIKVGIMSGYAPAKTFQIGGNGVENMYLDTTSNTLGLGNGSKILTSSNVWFQGTGGDRVTIGSETEAGERSVVIGTSAGSSANIVSIGFGHTGLLSEGVIKIGSGIPSSAANAISIGKNTKGGIDGVSFGSNAGTTTSTATIAIGLNSGEVEQGDFAIAIGRNTARRNQGEKATAIGVGSGVSAQGSSAVSLGTYDYGQYDQGDHCVSIGSNAGSISQTLEAIAIGRNAGDINQGQRAIAIGSTCGVSGQYANAIAIGYKAGLTYQNAASVSIGLEAGKTGQYANSVAIGSFAGTLNQYSNSVSVGNFAGYNTQDEYAVAIGFQAGYSKQGQHTLAIGAQAGKTSQSAEGISFGSEAGSIKQQYAAIAIGSLSGVNSQNAFSVAIGYVAGQCYQDSNAVAIGEFAGYNLQGQYGVAIGNYTGQTSQGTSATAIGYSAGKNEQGSYALAIGSSAGYLEQGDNAVAVGLQSGETSQGLNAVAVGQLCGRYSQNAYSIAIGNQAGTSYQNSYCISIGNSAGYSYQGSDSIAIGAGSGTDRQGVQAISIGVHNFPPQALQGRNSVSIGHYAGSNAQGIYSVAIGSSAGFSGQNAYSVSVGQSAGYNAQGSFSTYLGNLAGYNGGGYDSVICINATNGELNPTASSGCFIKPIRTTSDTNVFGCLQYESDWEVTKTPVINMSAVSVGSGSIFPQYESMFIGWNFPDPGNDGYGGFFCNRGLGNGGFRWYNSKLGTAIGSSMTDYDRLAVLDGSSNFTITGTLSKGSGTFTIDHPLPSMKKTHKLRHSFVEAPRFDNIYRDTVRLENGVKTINLDTHFRMTEGTFEVLNRDISVFTSNEETWDAVRGKVNGNILTIECQNSASNTTVSFMVVGERQDDHIKESPLSDDNGLFIPEITKASQPSQ